MPPRFLTLADVAETLSISASQTYALVRNGDLPAIKVGGRGQWRVEATELEAYIQRLYSDTADFVRTHPLGRDENADDDTEVEDPFLTGPPADARGDAEPIDING